MWSKEKKRKGKKEVRQAKKSIAAELSPFSRSEASVTTQPPPPTTTNGDVTPISFHHLVFSLLFLRRGQNGPKNLLYINGPRPDTRWWWWWRTFFFFFFPFFSFFLLQFGINHRLLSLASHGATFSWPLSANPPPPPLLVLGGGGGGRRKEVEYRLLA